MREGQPLPSVPPVKLNAAEPTQPPQFVPKILEQTTIN